MKFAAAALVGIQMHRLAILGHEGAHHLISRTPALNDGVTNVFCLFMFGITVAGYREWHFVHHRRVGTSDDTELVFKRGWRYSMPRSKNGFAGMFLLDLIGGGADEVLKLAWSSRPRSLRDALGLTVYWVVLVGLLAEINQLTLLAIHFGLVFTVFWAIFRIRGWSEHVGAEGPSHTHRLAVGPVIAYIFFPHYTWMHYEHHRFPTVPAHNLPLTRQAIGFSDVLDLQRLSNYFAGR